LNRGRQAAAILSCLLFSFVLWKSLEGLQGWPVEAAMPERFEVKWTLTEEPDRKGGHPGVVYVWAQDLSPRASTTAGFPRDLVRKGRSGEPRVYRLPYSRPLHELPAPRFPEKSPGSSAKATTAP
jgi:hypothetical protein